MSARVHFSACASTQCPQVIREDCARWGEELDAILPGAVLAVRDERGVDVSTYSVDIDGAPSSVRVGRSFSLDPGPHTLRVVSPTFAPSTVAITAREGEARRVVEVVLTHEPSPTKPVAEERRSVPTSSIVLGGIAALSLGTAGALFFSARGDTSDLRDRCHGTCDESVLDGARFRANLSGVLVGAAVVAIAGGLALWWLSPSSHPVQRQSSR